MRRFDITLGAIMPEISVDSRVVTTVRPVLHLEYETPLMLVPENHRHISVFAEWPMLAATVGPLDVVAFSGGSVKWIIKDASAFPTDLDMLVYNEQCPDRLLAYSCNNTEGNKVIDLETGRVLHVPSHMDQMIILNDGTVVGIADREDEYSHLFVLLLS
jgi:hypothetical protein